MFRKCKGQLKDAVNRLKVRIKPGQIFMLGFLAVILLGTFLLSLPIATKDGEGAAFITALFTATSATCVTGLVIEDTYTYWSMFGQLVILCMIQLGGLGFMTLISIVTIYTHKVIGLKERLMMMQNFGAREMSGIVRLTKRIICGTALFEGAGAVIFAIRFAKDFGFFGGIYKGIFHSVSAFCNAGFDLMGEVSRYSSMTYYASDAVMNITTMLLIVIGGIGFFVWDDIWENRGFRHLKVHSKFVLAISAVLVFGGALLFFLFERTNAATIGDMSLGEQILASLFQSVSTRTAGYNTIDQTVMTESSEALTILLMFIGGSPGSTAGGVKTVTVAVLLFAAFSSLRGRQETVIYRRSVPLQQMMSAMSLVLVGLTCVITGSFAISLVEQIPFFQVVYETVSAFATVGLTMSLTPTLSTFSHIILILLMYMGRIGLLTIGFGIMTSRNAAAKVRNPDANLMIG